MAIKAVSPALEIVEGLRVAQVNPDDTSNAIEALRARPDVVYAEPNFIRKATSTPNDPRYPEMWGLNNTGQPSTFGGNPLAIASANAVLDVMLKPGFFDHVQKMSLLLKQKLASVVDRYPTVLSEVRGEGLLVGVKAVVPSGDLVNALRDEKLLTVGAGDNVVRFLAPLIVTEAEIGESVQMLERACVALSGNQLKKAAG